MTISTIKRRAFALSLLSALCAAAPVFASNYYVVVAVKGRTVDPNSNISVSLNSHTLPEAMVGEPYRADLKPLVVVQGDPGYTGTALSWSTVSSSLPAGLVLNSDGTITGTPSSGGVGTIIARATYKTKRGEQGYEVVARNIIVNLPQAALPAGTVGTHYSFNLASSLTVTGDTAYNGTGVTWELVSGALPGGIALDTATGILSGSPSDAVVGKQFAVRASYRTKRAEQSYSMDIDAAGAVDPHWNNVVLLASPANGTYRDESKYAVALTPGSGVSIDSTLARFPGTSSMKFTPTSTGVAVPYSASKFDMASTNKVWTVEAWVYLQNAQSGIHRYRLDVLGNSGASNGWEAAIGSAEMGVIYPGYAGIFPATQITSGKWHHLAWQRNNFSYSFAVDGVIVRALTDSSSMAPNSFLKIGGNYYNTVNITYNIQDLRVTNGVLRYPTTQGATYTVPTEPFPRK